MAERAFIVPIVVFMVFSLVHHSAQLQPSQFEAVLRIKQQLNFPAELNSWSDNTDFCNSEPNLSLTLVCYEDNLTQLHVAGDSSFSFPQLSEDFSTVSLFTNLLSFPNLKVLSLVSLGLKGNLPAVIGKLTSLEIVNVSSNYFDGPIPGEISYLKNLQTLVMDDNMFTGQVPNWLGSSLPALSVLSMKNNSLSGSLPRTLSLSANLRILVLSGNLLSGDVPRLNNLSNLQVLDLEGNKFGPDFPRLPTKLVTLVLRKNNFKFAKLHELGSFFQLQKLDISMNQFMVPFSQSLFSLPSLTYLDVSGNKFTGKLFNDTSCSSELNFVNLSENRLTGDLPHCLQNVKNNGTVLYSGNCLSSESLQHQHPPAFCHNEALAVTILPHKQQKKVTSRAVLASSMAGGIVGGMVLLGLAFLVVRRQQRKKKSDKVPHTRLIMEKVSPASTLKVLKDASNISETRKLGPVGLSPYRTFVLDELREATNDFSTSNLISESSNGQVYRGWLTDGTLVAVRCLKMKKKHSIHSYTHQLELIAKLRHIHLVSAIGHCFDCYQDDSSVNKIHIVFEYVANGNLRSLISEGNVAKKLTWKQRLAAAIGIGRGIQFLHTGLVPGIFANQLKITDILMDHDYRVKISKYNLPLLDESRKLDNGAISSTGSKEKDGSKLRLVEKNDIHDFGVILLEMMVGRAINSVDDFSVSLDILQANLKAEEPTWRSIVDPAIHSECSNSSLKIMMELCVKCLSSVPSDMPSIEDVLWNLQFAAQVQDSWVRESISSSNQGSPIHLT